MKYIKNSFSVIVATFALILFAAAFTLAFPSRDVHAGATDTSDGCPVGEVWNNNLGSGDCLQGGVCISFCMPIVNPDCSVFGAGWTGTYPDCVAPTTAPSCTPAVGTACSAQTSCSDGSTLTNTGSIQNDCSCSASAPPASLCPTPPVTTPVTPPTTPPTTPPVTPPSTPPVTPPAPPGNPSQPPSGNSCSDTGPATLQASPSLVPNGTPATVTFTWNVSNASGVCTLKGTGVNTTTGAPNSCTIQGSYQASITITAPTTYTLTCPGGQVATTIVRTVPQVYEY